MARKTKVNKTQAVRDYLKTHPKATSGEIAAALNKQGIKLTANYVANIKVTIKKARTAKRAAKPQSAVEVAVEKPMKSGDTLTLEQVKKVAQVIRTLGGYKCVTEVLETIRESGGVKKFKELAEAISGSEMDAIPF
jgi:arginine repressor